MKRTLFQSAMCGALLICAQATANANSPKPMTTPEITQTGSTCTSACALPTDDAALRKLLTPEQYKIVKGQGTERAFDNAYWNNHAPGIYVDIVSGEPLFSSKDKFESGTGWPSFVRPLVPENIVEKRDDSGGMVRIEIRSKKANSHLGHLFDDGPKPTGLRYCMNSGALRFIPASELKAKGYGEFTKLFTPEELAAKK